MLWITIGIATVCYLLVLLPLLGVIRGKVTGKQAKRRLCYNLSGLGVVLLCGLLSPIAAFADGTAVEAAGVTAGAIKGIAAALAVGLGGIGGGLAVGPAASAAIGAMAEDSSTFGKSLIFVALGEGIAIYGLLISFLILFVL
jgi:V/A-type H+-transporting ATPase subunit K